MTGHEKANSFAGARILLVDDDDIILDSLGDFLEMEGYELVRCQSVARAIDHLRGGTFRLVITDVMLGESNGLELLRHIRENYPDLVVMVITGYGTIESAVEAMKQGAYEYLTKPIIDDDVRIAVRRALSQQNLIAENRQLRQALHERYSFSSVIGEDYRMQRVFDLLETAAESSATVLITGESGTGKSLVARAVHTQSPRREGPFVEVSCGALPDTLLESELFGHVKGAFTDATGDKTGKFAAADGGTIFLDEIATASPQLQVRLLRVLQEQVFEPVGSNESRQVDVRVILATNCDLAEEVKAGRFREDLYFRVNVVNVELPPLRERVADIPLLAEHFVDQYARENSKEIAGFSEEAIGLMRRYDWPGNVRELENCVQRAVVLCRQALIGPDDLPPAVLGGSKPSSRSEQKLTVAAAVQVGTTLEEAMEASERSLIEITLDANRGRRQETAEQLGINRVTLYKKMKKYGMM